MLLLARGLPVLLLRRDLRADELVPSALLQATSLSFIVVAAQIGVTVHALKPINAASLVAAGMLSVLVFPALALRLLDNATRGESADLDPDERAVEGMERAGSPTRSAGSPPVSPTESGEETSWTSTRSEPRCSSFLLRPI